MLLFVLLLSQYWEGALLKKCRQCCQLASKGDWKMEVFHNIFLGRLHLATLASAST